MTQLTKKSLEELAKEKPILTSEEQQTCVGGCGEWMIPINGGYLHIYAGWGSLRGRFFSWISGLTSGWISPSGIDYYAIPSEQDASQRGQEYVDKFYPGSGYI